MPGPAESTMPTHTSDENTARISASHMENIPDELPSDSHNADCKTATLPNLVGLFTKNKNLIITLLVCDGIKRFTVLQQEPHTESSKPVADTADPFDRKTPKTPHLPSARIQSQFEFLMGQTVCYLLFYLTSTLLAMS